MAEVNRRSVGVDVSETIFYDAGLERYVLQGRPTIEQINIWIDFAEAPVDAESAGEIDREK